MPLLPQELAAAPAELERAADVLYPLMAARGMEAIALGLREKGCDLLVAPSGAVFITSGTYADEALAFAQGKHLELIDGAQLDRMLRGVQEPLGTAPGPSAAVEMSAPQTSLGNQSSDRPRCPLCGSEMVLRWSKNRARAGLEFWGCSAFPQTGCSGAREVE